MYLFPTNMLCLDFIKPQQPHHTHNLLTSIVPIKESPLPHISYKPKYSPDFSVGMILAKCELDKALLFFHIIYLLIVL